ncbi:MAG: apolipoprotein N-acyltransferase [Desulfobacteraceae bacterium]|nr:apolipoprotein N-acyltransferase [Desulfobacteraceae bacterium]MBC2755865.1 apolipoprotein N-acyltransferase [Desulfobacteraceae bacterium]MBC2763968.1 apolipoprotein N-acyltransferase [ANME-2 cluster archaeon]
MNKAGPSQKVISFPFRIGLTLISALIWVAIFPCIDAWPLAWIGLLPFFFALSGTSAIQAFLIGWLFGSVHIAGVSYWLFNAFYFYSNAGLSVTIIFLIVIWGFVGLYFAGFAVIAAKIIQKNTGPVVKLIMIAGLWVAVELIRVHFLGGCPWALAGYSQYSWLNIIQIADVTGVYGVSFLILITNYAFFEMIQNISNFNRAFKTLWLPLCLIGVSLVYGSFRISYFSPANLKQSSNSEMIATIQGSVEQNARWKMDNREAIEALYMNMTAEALKNRAKLVIWPETVIPYYLQDSIPVKLQKMLKKSNASLITGGPRYALEKEKFSYYNTAFYVTSQGIEKMQDKIHLLPFGEYFPLGFIDVLKLRYAGPREYVPGNTFSIFDTPVGRVGTLICWEVIFSDLARQFVKHGADIIVNISNDSWFGRSSAHYQHFSMSVFRAVECRRPLVRSANTGISGFVDLTGNITHFLKPFTEGYLLNNPGTTDKISYYCKYGDIFGFFCCILFVILFLFHRT